MKDLYILNRRECCNIFFFFLAWCGDKWRKTVVPCNFKTRWKKKKINYELIFVNEVTYTTNYYIIVPAPSPTLEMFWGIVTGYSFWDQLCNFLHKFTWIVLSVHDLNKLGKLRLQQILHDFRPLPSAVFTKGRLILKGLFGSILPKNERKISASVG